MTNSDKIALVTGASQGIGKATALALLDEGYTVVLVARSQERLNTVAQGHSDRAHAIACDVTDPDAVDSLYAQIRERFGRLDVVFNNAGVSLPSTEIADISFKDWRNVLSVNLDGAFLIARGAFGLMRDQNPKGGRIINNGSISAHVPRIGSAAYTASKTAITGLTRTISLDGRKHDIA